MQTTTRAIWTVSLPIIFAGLGETAVELTDAMFLARYGMVELGAVALADALFDVSMFPLAGLIDGMQVLMSRRAGERRPRAIGAVFNQGLVLIVIASVILTAVVVLGGPVVTGLLVQSSQVRAAVDDFIGIIAFSLLFQGLNFAFSAFYTSIGCTRVLVGATLALVLTNIVLDYLLIFGHLGFAELGIRGAAIASLSAEIVGFAVIMAHLLIRRHHRKYQLFRLQRWSPRLVRRICSIAWPVSVEELIAALRWFMFFVIIERLGEHALAAANIVYSCYLLYGIAIAGFAETTCSMVSGLVGRRQVGAIRPLLGSITARCALFVLPLAIFALSFPELFAALFSDDPALVDSAILALRLATLALLAEVPGAILLSAITGLERTDVRLAIEVVVTVIVLLWATAVLLLGLDPDLVWLTELIGWSVCLIVAALWLRSESRSLA